ncbi:MAG: PEGA domain-containing protein [Candidatus Magasanikbacteria bacterium]|nr:PEGA domain-containing protein [Candidatus Magasanikbacteria bacterium]
MFDAYPLSRRIRLAIMLFLVAGFCVITPLLILFTAGYRYNWSEKTLVTTGVLSIDITPKDALVFVNDIRIEKDVPIRLTNLTPNNYHIRIQRDGFHVWEKDMTVQSNQTTYIRDISLLEQSTPMLVLSEKNTPSFSASGIFAATQTSESFIIFTIEGTNQTPIFSVPTTQETAVYFSWSPYDDYVYIVTVLDENTTEYLLSPNAPDGVKIYESKIPPTLPVQWVRQPTASVMVQRETEGLRNVTFTSANLVSDVQSPVWYVDTDNTVWTFDENTNMLTNTRDPSQVFFFEKPIFGIIDVTSTYVLAFDETNAFVIPKDQGRERVTLPYGATWYNRGTNEWIVASEWEIWTVYPDGTAELRNRTSDAMQQVLPLDANGLLLVVRKNSLEAFNPNPLYYTTHILLRDVTIEHIAVNTQEREIIFWGMVGETTGIFSVQY